MGQHHFSLYLNECLPKRQPAKVGVKVQVFSLVMCPSVAIGTRYTFVRIINGVPLTVGIGRAQSRHASLNLAAIRKLGAGLATDEVHLLV